MRRQWIHAWQVCRIPRFSHVFLWMLRQLGDWTDSLECAALECCCLFVQTWLLGLVLAFACGSVFSSNVPLSTSPNIGRRHRFRSVFTFWSFAMCGSASPDGLSTWGKNAEPSCERRASSSVARRGARGRGDSRHV